MPYFLTCFFGVILLKLFCQFKITGKQYVPRQGAYIIASNHMSFLDPPILGVSCFPRFLNFIAKDELFDGGFTKWYCSNTYCIRLKRKSGDFGAIKESVRRLKAGKPLAIFPEGERSIDGDLGDGLPGIGLIAAKTEVPVIPTYIYGSNNLLPKGSKRAKAAKVTVTFGKPLYFSSKKQKDYDAVTKEIMAAIKKLAPDN